MAISPAAELAALAQFRIVEVNDRRWLPISPREQLAEAAISRIMRWICRKKSTFDNGLVELGLCGGRGWVTRSISNRSLGCGGSSRAAPFPVAPLIRPGSTSMRYQPFVASSRGGLHTSHWPNLSHPQYVDFAWHSKDRSGHCLRINASAIRNILPIIDRVGPYETQRICQASRPLANDGKPSPERLSGSTRKYPQARCRRGDPPGLPAEHQRCSPRNRTRGC